MSTPAGLAVRRAGVEDAAVIGRLLHDFNTEYDDPTPGAAELAERIAQLLAGATRPCCSEAPDPMGSR